MILITVYIPLQPSFLQSFSLFSLHCVSKISIATDCFILYTTNDRVLRFLISAVTGNTEWQIYCVAEVAVIWAESFLLLIQWSRKLPMLQIGRRSVHETLSCIPVMYPNTVSGNFLTIDQTIPVSCAVNKKRNSVNNTSPCTQIDASDYNMQPLKQCSTYV